MSKEKTQAHSDAISELKRIGSGYSIDTDAYQAWWSKPLRDMEAEGLIKSSRLNNRQTWLVLTKLGHAALRKAGAL